MPRGRSTAIEDARLLAEHHIAGIRYTRRGRRISHVLHPVYGWITYRDYYTLQKIHDLEPYLLKVLEGAYRFKAAVFGATFEIPVLDTQLPVFLAFIAGAFSLAAQDAAAGRPELAALDVAALALPFGEIYLIVRGAIALGAAGAGAVDLLAILAEIRKRAGFPF